MNIADFFIGMGAGILVPIAALSIVYLAVKRILTNDPKIAVRFAMKHMGGTNNVRASATASSTAISSAFEGKNRLASSSLLQSANRNGETDI